MNDETRKENFIRLQKMFPNKYSINKVNMLKVVNSTYATEKRRNDANIKFDIPVPTHTLEFKRSSSAYFCYEYSLDDLSIFLTDRDFYWKMIDERQKVVNNEKSI